MARVVVTGGAGYVGSHVCRALARAGHDTLAYDHLGKGHRAALPDTPLTVGSLHDEAALERLLREFAADAVVHCAALIEAGESVVDPGAYYENNVGGSLCLMRVMVRTGVESLVLASTAAVYGEPERSPIPEDAPLRPVNPYGHGKLMVERMAQDFGRAHGLRTIALRFFNAAGAHADGDIGEAHSPESHLIPLVLQVALGQRECIYVFGEDYPTPDGTCVRDYVHVCDLADALVLAVESLAKGAPGAAYNLGNGEGYSVRQVIEAAREVTGHPIPAEAHPRRPGDPARLVASSDRIRRDLGWNPHYPGLREIIETAWRWHRSHPNGYAATG